ncbi:RNA polymerase Rpb1, domain 1 [Pelomyxa schiedti]|nr:RNA polymerase Rpb1, domain 1 [Pelomyxa schiedti]
MMGAAPKLDATYFQVIEERREGEWVYQAYRPVYPERTMVLFSCGEGQMGQPLAAFTMCIEAGNRRGYGSGSSTGGGARILMTKRERPPPDILGADADNTSYFQGLFSADNQEFSMAISNLTHFSQDGKIGYINFNILHTAHQVREVDPGPEWGVNQVNEIRPSQSYKIESDQRNNRSLKLVGATRTNSFGVVEKLTVQEDEEQARGRVGQNTQGTYFHLSVLGSSKFPEMADLFRQTKWKCVDVFVRRVYSPQPRLEEKRMRAREENHIMACQQTLSDTSSLATGGSPQFWGNSFEGGMQRESAKMASPSTPTCFFMQSVQPTSTSATMNAVGACAPPSSMPTPTPAFMPQSQTLPTLPVVRHAARRVSSVSADILEEEAESPHSTKSADFFAVEEGSIESKESTSTVDMAVVNATQTGTLAQGERVISVHTSSTGYTYFYDFPSEPCIIGLSIWTAMTEIGIVPPAELRTLAATLLSEFMTQANRPLVDSLTKKFKSDECVLCLDVGPDLLFLQCGHQCCHLACTLANPPQACPLCRGRIAARVLAGAL